MPERLPIDAILPELLTALAENRQAVLQAPPGAGKTTRVPLAMFRAGFIVGRILMLEPRRLATRTAAERMADSLREKPGQTVGYRIKGEARISAATQIEVVTEGILTRMIQSDPELPGIGAIIFDEFHERSLQADLGLALCLELREALRADIVLLVMSATLDAAPVAALLGNAPVITSTGQIHPVETRWLDRPWAQPGRNGVRFATAMADLVLKATQETEGGILVFLPGEGEIRQVVGLLRNRLPADTSLHPLFGAMEFKAQRAAIAPVEQGRKIVLATAIAETSLTIQGIRVVVDGGRARRARFDPASGMSRLVTEKVTKAEATQRRGRAGRVESGICYRLWTKGEEGGLAPFAPPEIETADLTPLVLETAAWGAANAGDLPFLSPPNAGGVARATALLQGLGALDRAGRITPHGQKMARLPLHPRLAHMVLRGGKTAPELAALLAERDIISSGIARPPAGLSLRVAALRNPKQFESDHPFTANRGVLGRIKSELARLKPRGDKTLSIGEMAALAYPDRIGLRRKGGPHRYVLSGGKGAFFEEGEPLAQSRFIVACDLDGDTKEARIRLAADLSEAELRGLYGSQIIAQNICGWSRRNRTVEARRQEIFGALVLSDAPWPNCPPDIVAAAMIDGIRDLGLDVLNLKGAARLLIARVEWLRARGADMPDFSQAGLLKNLEVWLAPYLGKCQRLADLNEIDIQAALKTQLDWNSTQLLDQLAPSSITAPTGTRLSVDYASPQPMITVRLQELFGLNRHPTIGPEKTPLLIELLSPARRPVQTTADLPGFWASSYADVRKDMRGRYPKHPWPEDPANATPTRRVKPAKP